MIIYINDKVVSVIVVVFQYAKSYTSNISVMAFPAGTIG